MIAAETVAAACSSTCVGARSRRSHLEGGGDAVSQRPSMILDEAACRGSFRLFDFLGRTLFIERLGWLLLLIFLSILALAHRSPRRSSAQWILIIDAGRAVKMKSLVAFPGVTGIVQMSIRWNTNGDACPVVA